MKPIQPLLACALLATFLLYFRYFRSSLIDRVFSILIFLAGFLAVLFPQLTSSVANFLGVGRGTDLCFYIISAATIFSMVLLYSKISRLEKVNTKLVRWIAIATAEQSASSDPTSRSKE
jgi:hypothetical protein